MEKQLLKVFTIILFLILLSSCHSSIESYEIKKAEELCKEHEGIFHISTINLGVRCNDGEFFFKEKEN